MLSTIGYFIGNTIIFMAIAIFPLSAIYVSLQKDHE